MSTRQPADDARVESVRISPEDPQYLAVVEKRFNKRFSARPDYVRLASSTEQVVSAVEEAGEKDGVSSRPVAGTASRDSCRIPRCG